MDSSSSSDRVEEWERGLPSADDLIPLSQLLISPQLAYGFSVSLEPTRTLLDVHVASQTTVSSLRDSPEPRSKKRRLAWTPHLHKRFVEVVNHLGVHNAVPKTIMQMMNVEGLTRENVASHLQKYRAFLKSKEVGENPAAAAASTPSPSVSIPEYGGGTRIMHPAVGHPYVVYGDRQRDKSSGVGSSRVPNGSSGDGM